MRNDLPKDLNAYVDEQHSLLQRFQAWWLKRHEADPEMFPMQLPDGDWDEQMHFFSEMKDPTVKL